MVQNHYGNGYRNGNSNGKRWLLIVALILGAFWLSSSSYHEGFSDGMIASGQNPAAVRYRGGPHFPWEILIVGGIAYIAWRKGAFDRFGGPGGPFGGGPRDLQQYGPGSGQTPPYGPGQGFGPAFRGPRAFFDDWHRQAHEAERAQYPAPSTPPTPPAAPQSPSTADVSGNGAGQPASQPVGQYAPAPSAPSPEYWTTINRPAGTTETSANPGMPQAPTNL